MVERRNCEHCAGQGILHASFDPYAGSSLVHCDKCMPELSPRPTGFGWIELNLVMLIVLGALFVGYLR